MFSFVIPLDENRLELFKVTKRLYDKQSPNCEFIIPTRNELKVARYLDDNKLSKGVKIIPYTVKEGFNCSKALNIGVRAAKYASVIITSPEVKPTTNVLEQLEPLRGKNVICQVADQDENGNLSILVCSTFRADNPAMYFLAMFNKKDIEKINGWDEDFMNGYAYEDNDFGARFARAGLPYEFHDEIQATHQYHPRLETISGGLTTNLNKFQANNANAIVQAVNGLYNLEGEPQRPT